MWATVIKSSRVSHTAEAVSSPRPQADALLRKDLAKFYALYYQYSKDSVLLGALAYNCGPGVVNKSTVLKKLKRGDRNIFKSYTAHCKYKGRFHKGLYKRRCQKPPYTFRKINFL